MAGGSYGKCGRIAEKSDHAFVSLPSASFLSPIDVASGI